MTEEKPSHRSRRGHANLAVITVAAVFCTMVAAGAGYVVIRDGNRPPEVQYPQLEPEGNVKRGTLNDPAGRQAELDAIVEEGMLTFSINATPVMKHGQAAANFLIENPPNNGNRFTVTISREDTGETIYQSGYLDPEQYIEEANLDAELPPGEYSCLAYFDAYRISDNAYIGRAAARITLYVQE